MNFVRYTWRLLVHLFSFALVTTVLPLQAETIDIKNVRVVDVRAGKVLENQHVRVEGERIVHISAASRSPSAAADTTIDARGAYLAPGLMDMHFHAQAREHLTLGLLRGVTTIRNMWGNPETLAWRAEVEEGTLAGSRVITAGIVIDGEPRIWPGSGAMSDPQEAEMFVTRQQRAGYDFIKPYSRLTPDVFAAILKAGDKLDMEIAGHVPQDVPLLDAINGGLRTSEHLIGVLHAVARDRSLPNPSLSPYDERAKALVIKFGTGEVPTENFIDPKRVQRVARAAREQGHWFVPTIRVMRNFGTSPVPCFADLERFAGPMEIGMMPMIKAGTLGKVFFNLTEEHQRGEDKHQELRREAILALYEAGAPILAGTDSFQAGVGTVLVDEMRDLHDLGIPRDAVLRAATLEPARYLEREGELGEVREGAIADLVLTRENPLQSLSALYAPTAVMKAGVWYDAATIESMLSELEAAFAAKQAPTAPNAGHQP